VLYPQNGDLIVNIDYLTSFQSKFNGYRVPELRERQPVAGRRLVSAFAGRVSVAAAAPEPLRDGDGRRGGERDGERDEEAAEVAEVQRAEPGDRGP